MNRPLRIGLFTNSYPPIVDGVSVLVAEHHAELLLQGQESHIFTFGYRNHRDVTPNVWRSPGIPLGIAATPRLSISKFRANFRLDQRSMRIVETLDVIHVHDPFSISDIGFSLAQRYKIPLVFTNHTRHDLYLQNYSPLTKRFLQRYMEYQLRRIITNAAQVTAPSTDTVHWLQSLVQALAPIYRDRIQVMNNPINLHKFENPTPRSSRTSLKIAPSTTIFMYVGRLTPEKNLLAFAEAFSAALDAGADVHWVIIGEGIEERTLSERLEGKLDRVSFLGQIEPDELPGYLLLADVFATTSISETNPLSVTEALASAKPFIGWDAPWWHEYPNHERAGLLASTPTELVTNIQFMVENPAQRLAMGQAAKQISRAFDSRSFTARWISIYEGVAQAPLP